MPRYDFLCPKCGRAFEVLRPVSQAAEPAFCPQDGAQSERVFTMPMTLIKGAQTGAPDSSPPLPQHGHSHGPDSHVH